MDSSGRLFVGDRSNNRIQIFDQNGTFIEEWKQFSRPSGDLHRQERTTSTSRTPSPSRCRRTTTAGSAASASAASRTARMASRRFIPTRRRGLDLPITSPAPALPKASSSTRRGNIFGAEVGPHRLICASRSNGHCGSTVERHETYCLLCFGSRGNSVMRGGRSSGILLLSHRSPRARRRGLHKHGTRHQRSSSPYRRSRSR